MVKYHLMHSFILRGGRGGRRDDELPFLSFRARFVVLLINEESLCEDCVDHRLLRFPEQEPSLHASQLAQSCLFSGGTGTLLPDSLNFLHFLCNLEYQMLDFHQSYARY